MDCGAFHRNLDDYLEGGLDYSGRLGMERHSEQCLSCGQELAQAQELHSMAAGLRSVTAPEGFEHAVLQRINACQFRGGLWNLCRNWIYELEWASWRRIAVASSSLAILALAALFLAYRSGPDRTPLSSLESGESGVEPSEFLSGPQNLPLISQPPVADRPAINAAMMETAASIGTPATIIPRPLGDGVDGETGWRLESADSEFVEYQIQGPDDHPLVVRLPKTIRMRYGQPSEEYFIRNVSH